MAGPNTTGLPQTEDYVLGRGIIYFASINTSTGLPDADGWRDLGNAPEMAVSIEVETLEHQSSRGGLKVVDKEVVVSQKANVTFALDEINHENLSLFFSGAKAAHTNVAIAGFTQFEMVSAVKLGRWYDIVNSAGERAYDIETGDLAAENGDDATALVENTDYVLDLEMGMIQIMSTASNIAGGEALDITLTAEATAGAVNEVRGLTQTNVIGALKFVGINPANNNKKEEHLIQKVQLKADGDFSLISDEFTQMSFTAAAESNTLADPLAPIVRIRTVV